MTERDQDRGPAAARRVIAAIAVLLLCGGWDWLQSADADVERGNQLYARGDYAGALASYTRALENAGDAHRVRFDMGTALLQMARAEGLAAEERSALVARAEDALRRAAESRDAALRSAAYYNLGNLALADERYPDAIDAYKKALRASWRNDDARYNLELALRRQGGTAAGRPPAPGPGQAPPTGPPGDQPGVPGEAPGGPADGERPGQPGATPPQAGAGAGTGSGGEQGAAGEGAGAGDTGAERGDDGGAAGGAASGPAGDDAAGAETGAQERGQERGQAGGENRGEDPREGEDADRRIDEHEFEIERKLDALERMSRELRKRQFRGDSRDRRGVADKDW